MRSSEGEVVPLVDVIQTALARGQVEKWLVELETDMKKSVHNMVAGSIDDYPKTPREQWVLKWTGQCVQSVGCTFWTTEVTVAINGGIDKLKAYLSKCNYQISKIVDLVRGKLSTQNRITLGTSLIILIRWKEVEIIYFISGALVVLDVHARDVLAGMIDQEVKNVHDFKWLCQLRYYWEVWFT